MDVIVLMNLMVLGTLPYADRFAPQYCFAHWVLDVLAAQRATPLHLMKSLQGWFEVGISQSHGYSLLV